MLKKWYLAFHFVALGLWMVYIVMEHPENMAGHLTGWGVVCILGLAVYFSKPAPEPPAQELVIPEGEKAKGYIDDLARSIERLNENLDNAGQRIEDIKVRSGMLVNLVQVLSIRADQMAAEATLHGELLDAIQLAQTTNNLIPVFKLAGQIGDPLISNMVFTSTTNAGYWMGATKTIAANFGVLRQWSTAYNDYAHDLLLQVAKNQKRLAELKARHELAGLVEPLAFIQNNFNQAEGYLRIERPALAGIAPGLRTGMVVGSVPQLGRG